MGLLKNRQWVDQWYETKNNDGEFRRQDSRFRSWINPTGIIPVEPEQDFTAAHSRDGLKAAHPFAA